MWQRFTERARSVILHAQDEAGKMSSGHVGIKHLLLGLARARRLTDASVDAERLRTLLASPKQRA